MILNKKYLKKNSTAEFIEKNSKNICTAEFIEKKISTADFIEKILQDLESIFRLLRERKGPPTSQTKKKSLFFVSLRFPNPSN